MAVTGVKGYLNREKKDNVGLALIRELDADYFRPNTGKWLKVIDNTNHFGIKTYY